MVSVITSVGKDGSLITCIPVENSVIIQIIDHAGMTIVSMDNEDAKELAKFIQENVK